MGEVARLEPREGVAFDRERLRELVAVLGDAAAETAITHTFDELAEALAEIDAAWRARDARRIVLCAEGVVMLGEEAGMAALARIARTVCETGRSGDPAGFAATVGRLKRILEGSVRLACEPCDLIG